MCRRAKVCACLGDDPSKWSRRASLPPPVWFEHQLTLFEDAVKRAANGEREEAVRVLQGIKSDAMREWFDEHGQMSGWHRVKKFGVASPKVAPDLWDAVRSPARHESLVFQRDSYTCRYCGLRQVAKEILLAFERAVGSEEFPTQGTNAMQHGIIHGFKIVADHVVPYKCGGKTNVDNLVSACPACNYGKYNYTLEQLGLDDPRTYPPVVSGWDGLTSLLQDLKRYRLDSARTTHLAPKIAAFQPPTA
jgi:hypothetical protein